MPIEFYMVLAILGLGIHEFGLARGILLALVIWVMMPFAPRR